MGKTIPVKEFSSEHQVLVVKVWLRIQVGSVTGGLKAEDGAKAVFDKKKIPSPDGFKSTL